VPNTGATPGALAALKKSGQQPGEFLTRHVNRECGDLSDEDRKENDYSLEHGFRLLSVYRTHWRQVVDYHRVRPLSDHALVARGVLDPTIQRKGDESK
jgi:hypothetical protein